MKLLNDLLRDFKVQEHKPSLPQQRHTPKPEKSKVMANPVRVPVNKQAAFVIKPTRCWLEQPLPEKLPTKENRELAQLKAQLKEERNESALVRDDLGNTRIKLAKSKLEIASLTEQVRKLKQEIAQRDDTIRQLEYIRL